MKGMVFKIMTGAVLMASVAGTSQAQLVQVQTTGCFKLNDTCNYQNSTSKSTGLRGTLSFTGGTFTSTGNTVNLGTVNVDAGGFFDTSLSVFQPFRLKTVFLQPLDTDPGSESSLSFIDGVLALNNGLYALNFANTTPTHYTYGGGAFDFTVNDPGVLTQSGDFALTGTISNVTTTPEPGSMALLGTGLVGLVPMVRRRRK